MTSSHIMQAQRKTKRQRTAASSARVSGIATVMVMLLTAPSSSFMVHVSSCGWCGASFVAVDNTWNRRGVSLNQHHVALTSRTTTRTTRRHSRHGFSFPWSTATTRRTFLESSTKAQHVVRAINDNNSNNNYTTATAITDWKSNPLAAIMKVDIAKMTPNDAAAALRQLGTAVVRFDRNRENDAPDEQGEEGEETEVNKNARVIQVRLLSIIEKSVYQNPKSQQQQQQQQPGKCSSLSMYAIVDTLVALAALTDQDKRRRRRSIIISQPPPPPQQQQQQQQDERYQRLARAVWMQLSRVVAVDVVKGGEQPALLQQQPQKFPLGPRLTLDCLCAAHTLQLLSSSTSSTSTSTTRTPSSNLINTNDSPSGADLYTALCHRLTRGDALSRLSSANLAKCLQSTLASLVSTSSSSSSSRDATSTSPTRSIRGSGRGGNSDSSSLSIVPPALHDGAKDDNKNIMTATAASNSSTSRVESLLLRALARRFRKAAVRQTMSSPLLLQRIIPCLVMFLERVKENDSFVDSGDDDDDDSDERRGEEDNVDLKWEMQRLTFTLVKDLMARLLSSPTNAAGEHSSTTNNRTGDDGQGEHVVTGTDLAWLVRACGAVTKDKRGNEDNEGMSSSPSSLQLVHDYMTLLHQYQKDDIMWNKTATLYDLDVVLQALQLWKRSNFTATADDEFVVAAIVKNLGAVLFDRLGQQQNPSLEAASLSSHQQQVGTDNNSPINQQCRIVTSILRSAVLMYRDDSVIMKDFIHAWEMMLFENGPDNPFWAGCHISDLANWVWFAYMTRSCSIDSLISGSQSNIPESQQQQYIVRLECLSQLGRLMLQPKTIAHCTPKLACRILSSYTAIVSLLPSSISLSSPSENSAASDYKEKEAELREILHSLFTRLGEYLLSQRLSALDVSRAIIAYAKAPYVEDMGIFDHLVEVLATTHLYPEPDPHDQQGPPPSPPLPLRSVAQCLWACGKMATWDEQHDGNSATTLLDVVVNRNDFDTMRPITVEPPPYLGGARDMAYYLMDHSDELSTKDTAQALSAMAHLQMPDSAAIVETLVHRIKVVGPHMTAQEVSNSLWALSKLRTNSFDAVFILSQRVIRLITDHDDENNSVFTSQEAAIILNALGRLHLRQEEIFDKLSTIILQQIDTTTAMTVANVLWAHRAVYILPPQALLDTWAKKKLGLKAIADDRQQPQDYYYSSW